MALAGEVGELVAELQWLTPEEAERVMADPEPSESAMPRSWAARSGGMVSIQAHAGCLRSATARLAA